MPSKWVKPEGHERKGERHGQRRGGGVDAPDRETVPRLAGERQRDEAEEVDDEDEQQQARHVGEPAADRLRRQALLGDLRLRDLVDLLADRLACARLDADARAHEEDPERHRDDRAEQQVHDGLVDRHVDRAEVDLDPGIELELVRRVELAAGEGLARSREREGREDEQSTSHTGGFPK